MKGGILMIIANSNVTMSSRRHFSQNVTSSQTSVNKSARSFQLGMTSIRASYSQNEFYYSNNSHRSDDNSFGTPVYNRFGLLDGENDSLKTGTDTTAKSLPDRINFSYKEITRKLYLSLLDFIQSLSLRDMFYDYNNNTMSGTQTSSDSSNKGNSLIMTNQQSPSVWSVSTRYSSTYEESESTSFSTTGTVRTADGRELDFNLDMTMSRKYMEEHCIEFAASYDSVLTDPLVINLSSNPVSVSDKSFSFDIDADGNDEIIAQMNPESGFLALDKNGDGIINDGSELFGAKTGNGFSELAEYDSDGNGWIDEIDEIYNQLKVWVKDENGNDKLLSLKEADVGAIYLGKANTTFHVTDDNNRPNAKVESSGVYLHEDGSAGLVQQVDF